MSAFVDSSALYALLDARDRSHPRARETLDKLLGDDERLVTHNYVLVETTALAQRRLGAEAVGVLRDDLTAVLRVSWVDDALHEAALGAVVVAARRDPSFVDRVSFELMRRVGLRRAFAFDADFGRQGFELLPTGEVPPVA